MTQHAAAPAPELVGFAALSPERRREMARLGGLKVQALGTGNRFDSTSAAAAGRKGKGRPKTRRQTASPATPQGDT